MGTRILARRIFFSSVVNGADGVQFGIWLPANTMVNRVSGFIGLEGATVQTALSYNMAGVEGWVLPISDPDQADSMDIIWDKLVPKDTGGNTMDLDSATAQGAPFYEPGATIWEGMFDIGAQPVRVFHRELIFGLGHNALLVNQDPDTPFGLQYVPGMRVPLAVSPFRVREPSLLVFAVASPDTLETDASSAILALAEENWGQLQFIDHVMERAMLSLLGLTEPGATTPWNEATLLLRDYVDPKIYETVAGALVPLTWRTHGMSMTDLTVEGEMPKRAITGSR